MSDKPAGRAKGEKTEPEWKRRKRLDGVFGDVLPETTSDERDPAAPGAEDAGERWLREQVPPHHG
ncbi:hypothetical protein [Nocardioides sp.]|uniref:hypothetical protein n=1 Tax=Nocardioides sp. TaxID=35761 RepID=UPI0035671158